MLSFSAHVASFLRCLASHSAIVLFKLSMRALEISLVMSIYLCFNLRLATFFYVEETKPASMEQALTVNVLFVFQQTGKLRDDWFACNSIPL